MADDFVGPAFPKSPFQDLTAGSSTAQSVDAYRAGNPPLWGNQFAAIQTGQMRIGPSSVAYDSDGNPEGTYALILDAQGNPTGWKAEQVAPNVYDLTTTHGDYLQHMVFRTDPNYGYIEPIQNTQQQVNFGRWNYAGSGLSAMLQNPMVPLMLSTLAPGAGAAVGAALGIEGTAAATAVGNAVINAGTQIAQGKDIDQALLSAGLGIAGSALGADVNKAIDTSLADLGSAGDLAGNLAGKIAQGYVQTGGKADPLALLESGAIGEAVGAAAREIPGFDSLSQSSQRSVIAAMTNAVQGKDPTLALLNAAKGIGQQLVSQSDTTDLLDNVMGLEAGPTQPQNEADLLDNVMGTEAQPTQPTEKTQTVESPSYTIPVQLEDGTVANFDPTTGTVTNDSGQVVAETSVPEAGQGTQVASSETPANDVVSQLEQAGLQGSDQQTEKEPSPNSPEGADQIAQSEGWANEAEKNFAVSQGFSDPQEYRDSFAQRQGWDDYAQKQLAADLGYTNPQTYDEYLAQQEGWASLDDKNYAISSGLNTPAEYNAWLNLEQPSETTQEQFNFQQDQAAQALGWKDANEQLQAQEMGIDDPQAFRDAWAQQDGWKDYAQQQRALSLGYTSFREYRDIAAQEEGWESYAQKRLANARGLDTPEAYDEWLHPKQVEQVAATGLEAAQKQEQDAQDAGWKDYAEQYNAEGLGFSSPQDYRDFTAKSDGWADAEEQETANQQGYFSPYSYHEAVDQSEGWRSSDEKLAAAGMGMYTPAEYNAWLNPEQPAEQPPEAVAKEDTGAVETQPTPGIQVAGPVPEDAFKMDLGGSPIYGETSRADSVTAPFGYDLLPLSLADNKPEGSYYDPTQNAWFMPNQETEDLQKTLEETQLPEDYGKEVTSPTSGSETTTTEEVKTSPIEFFDDGSYKINYDDGTSALFNPDGTVHSVNDGASTEVTPTKTETVAPTPVYEEPVVTTTPENVVKTETSTAPTDVTSGSLGTGSDLGTISDTGGTSTSGDLGTIAGAGSLGTSSDLATDTGSVVDSGVTDGSAIKNDLPIDQNAGSLGSGSDLGTVGEIDPNAGSIGSGSDLEEEEEPQCAPGYHWNGSICVADTDVEDTSTTCPEGYLFDLATQTCVPISTNVDVTKPTTPITNPTGPAIPKNPTIPSTPINQNIQKPNFDLAALLSILGAASAQPQQAPAQEQQRYMQEMDFEGPLDVNFFSPAKKNVAGQNQQQTTKIATGGYIDDLLKILRG